MARSNNNFLNFAFASANVLRNPGRYKICSQLRFLYNLLYDMFELIKGCAFNSRKIMKSRSVLAVAEVAGFQSALGAFFRRCPRLPPIAAKFLQLLYCARSVYKCADFSDSLLPDRNRQILALFWVHVTLGNHRKAVFQFETHRRRSNQGERIGALLAGNAYALFQYFAEQALVLSVRCSVRVGFHMASL